MEVKNPGEDQGRLKRIGRFLTKAGKKILPAVAGIAVGTLIGPAAAPIAQFIASKLSGTGINVDPENIESIIQPILSGGGEVTTTNLLAELIKKHGSIDDKRIDILIEQKIPQIEERINIAVNASIRPTLDAFREAIEFIQDSPHIAIEELNKLKLELSSELNQNLIKFIYVTSKNLEERTRSDFNSIMVRLSSLSSGIGFKLDVLSDQLTKLMTRLTSQPSSNLDRLTPELALALCAEQIGAEPILSRYDERFDPDRYVNRTDAEREIYHFISLVRSPGGLKGNIFVLLAAMGMGKTWLLGNIVHELLAKKIPALFFELRHGDITRIQRIVGASSPMDAHNRISRIVESLKTPIILFMDGVDELPAGERRTLLNWIIDARTRLGYGNVGFILSCRDYDWLNDSKLQEISRSCQEMYYKGNPISGSCYLKIFDEVQLQNAANKYGIFEDIERNAYIKELAKYPFVIKLLGQYKVITNFTPLPDPANTEEFLPLFYNPDNESETILGRMGVISEVVGYLGTLLECCIEPYLRLDMIRVKSLNLDSSDNFNKLISSGLFIRQPGLREIVKINPLYQPFVKSLMDKYKIRGITQKAEEVAAQSEVEPAPIKQAPVEPPKEKMGPFRSKMVKINEIDILQNLQKEINSIITNLEVNDSGSVISIDFSDKTLKNVPKTLSAFPYLMKIKFSGDSFEDDDDLINLVFEGKDVFMNDSPYEKGYVTTRIKREVEARRLEEEERNRKIEEERRLEAFRKRKEEEARKLEEERKRKEEEEAKRLEARRNREKMLEDIRIAGREKEQRKKRLEEELALLRGELGGNSLGKSKSTKKRAKPIVTKSTTSSSTRLPMRAEVDYTEAINTFRNDELVIINPWTDRLDHFRITIIGKKGTPYDGGKFVFEIKLPSNYPFSSPYGYCHTLIWHPNIDPSIPPGRLNICLDLLIPDLVGKVDAVTGASGWTPSKTLTNLIEALEGMIHMQPPFWNPGDPLNHVAGEMALTQTKKFFKKAREWTKKYAS